MCAGGRGGTVQRASGSGQYPLPSDQLDGAFRDGLHRVSEYKEAKIERPLLLFVISRDS